MIKGKYQTRKHSLGFMGSKFCMLSSGPLLLDVLAIIVSNKLEMANC